MEKMQQERNCADGPVQGDDVPHPSISEIVALRKLTVKNTLESISELEKFVAAFATEYGLSDALAMKLNLAMEETLSNIIFYAYPPGEKGLVTIEIECRHHEVAFTITDEGVPFNPLTEAEEVDITRNTGERPVGGLGIFLLKQIMDDIDYIRTDGKNRLRAKKKIE